MNAHHEMRTIFEVIQSGDYLILDTETTGLSSGSEICQIAIIDSSGKALLDTLVRPVKPIPEDATRIHGITNEHVKEVAQFPVDTVYQLLKGRNVIIYNRDYDVRMLYRSTRMVTDVAYEWSIDCDFYCAMETFAEIYGEYNQYHGSYRWQKLETACAYYKVKATDAHNALADCLSTLAVCKAMGAKQDIGSARL